MQTTQSYVYAANFKYIIHGKNFVNLFQGLVCCGDLSGLFLLSRIIGDGQRLKDCYYSYDFAILYRIWQSLHCRNMLHQLRKQFFIHQLWYLPEPLLPGLIKFINLIFYWLYQFSVTLFFRTLTKTQNKSTSLLSKCFLSLPTQRSKS